MSVSLEVSVWWRRYRAFGKRRMDAMERAWSARFMLRQLDRLYARGLPANEGLTEAAAVLHEAYDLAQREIEEYIEWRAKRYRDTHDLTTVPGQLSLPLDV